ncbi:Protein-cysteine N-palmitoyltransferase HHAT [Galemys pyrenaicus]|uniref:Protein-cysteine N-palmitoyltransferase HHAT n=1 Tax=Galemys pyrenaicus TaxID=202257 RepID=A0A8J5ZCM3_GALPY|nr:Protein-cysteine N-palmitoyltransferase HHAT [Galemys pyrenaicus]
MFGLARAVCSSARVESRPLRSRDHGPGRRSAWPALLPAALWPHKLCGAVAVALVALVGRVAGHLVDVVGGVQRPNQGGSLHTRFCERLFSGRPDSCCPWGPIPSSEGPTSGPGPSELCCSGCIVLSHLKYSAAGPPAKPCPRPAHPPAHLLLGAAALPAPVLPTPCSACTSPAPADHSPRSRVRAPGMALARKVWALSPPARRRVHAALASCSTSVLILSNLVFLGGGQVGKAYWDRIFVQGESRGTGARGTPGGCPLEPAGAAAQLTLSPVVPAGWPWVTLSVLGLLYCYAHVGIAWEQAHSVD